MMAALVRELRNQHSGRVIVGMDADPLVSLEPKGGFDEVVTVPPATADNYVDTVLDASLRFAPAVIVPGSDEEAEALVARNREFAARNLLVNLSPTATVSLMRDKYRLTLEAKAAGCDVAETRQANTWADVRAAARELGYPERSVVIKPVSGRGRRLTCFASRAAGPNQPDVPPSLPLEDIEGWMGLWPGPLLVCLAIEGVAMTADLLCRKGDLECAVVRQWLGRGRFPFPGQVIVDAPETVSVLGKLARRIGIHGLVDADLIAAPGGKTYLLEINPRPSGSVAVTLAAGIPLYDMLIDVLAGRPVKAPPTARRRITSVELGLTQ